MTKKKALRLALITLACSISYGAYADPKPINVPPGDLIAALESLAKQSGVEFVYQTNQLKGLRTRGVTGTMSPQQAVTKLLEGTPLKLRTDEVSGAMLIAPPRANRDADKSVSQATTAVQDANTATRLSQADIAARKAIDESSGPGADLAEIEVTIPDVIVVGTLLRDATPTSPVLTFHRDDIERGGYTSTEEIFAKLPQNFGSTSADTASFGGGNLGATTQIDLRGLGSEATLTLVNGRRISSAAGDQGRAVDISMIPIAAIERIDILTDGASALYGSDAIGGVVNFVLRKDFDGAQTSVQYGDDDAGSADLQFTQLFGASWSSGRILTAAQYGKSGALGYRDIGIDTFDFRSRGGSDQRTPYLGSPGTVLPAGVFVGMPFSTVTGPGGQPVFSATLPPGDGTAVTLDQLGLNQSTSGDLGLGEFAPEQENISGYLTVEQELGSVTLFADGVFARRQADLATGVVGDYLYVPATNAFSPFSEDVFVAYLFNDLGSLRNEVQRDGWFANLGARAPLGIADWTWEAVGSLSEDKSTTRFELPNAFSAEFAEFLASSDPAVAFNPFGDGSVQSQQALKALTMELVNVGNTSMKSLSTQAQGSLWQMPGGLVRLALGAEYREEELETVARQGALTVSTIDPSRDVSSVFGELYVPFVGRRNARALVRELAFSAAVRYEQYSDQFGETTNPKFGFLWRPTQNLALKANWGTSFRAPSLRELYSRTTSSLTQVLDPNAPGGPAAAFVLRNSGGNEALLEETAETYTVSGEYRPAWLQGARVSLSYFHTAYDDRIRGLLDGLTLSTILQLEDSLPPGIITRDAGGNLVAINATNINSASTTMAGYDLMAGYSWTTQQHGGFDLSAAASFYSEYEDELLAGTPVFDLKGTVGNPPDWRGRIGFNWFNGPWGAALSVNYMPDLRNEDADTPIVVRAVESQTTVDVQLSFSSLAQSGWLKGFVARLGVNNLLDEPAPFVDGQQRRGLDIRNHIVDGRTVYLNLSKGFGAAAQSRAQK